MSKKSICALHLRICAVRYGSNCSSEEFFPMIPSIHQPCGLRNMQLIGGKTFSCQESCSIPRYVSSSTPHSFRLPFFCSEEEHESHSCDARLCLVTCELCKGLCDQPHLHGLTPGAHHLCGSVDSHASYSRPVINDISCN